MLESASALFMVTIVKSKFCAMAKQPRTLKLNGRRRCEAATSLPADLQTTNNAEPDYRHLAFQSGEGDFNLQPPALLPPDGQRQYGRADSLPHYRQPQATGTKQ